MSNTSLTALNMLFRHIEQSVLMTDIKKPNGELRKFSRALDSEKEDVVINSLPVNREVVQEGLLNVNVFVPNLKLPSNPGDKLKPDTARLLYLSALGNQALGSGDEIWDANGDYCFTLQQDNIMEDENNQYYINFRVEFNSSNN